MSVHIDKLRCDIKFNVFDVNRSWHPHQSPDRLTFKAHGQGRAQRLAKLRKVLGIYLEWHIELSCFSKRAYAAVGLYRRGLGK